jgi:CRP/FNR family transcriptional regulator
MGSILTNRLTSELIKASNIRAYTKGQTILYPHDNLAHLYVVKSGAVMMHDIDDAGNRKILYTFGPPTLFPMVSFLENTAQSAWFYTTLVDTEVYVIPYEQFKEKLQDKKSYEAYNAILRQALKEVHELLLHITDHVKTDSTEKIISMLLFLMTYHTKAASKAWRPVLFPVSHQLMAEMTGLTRETVTLIMKELTEKKLVRYPSKAVLELNYNNLCKQKHA